jgi:hypothetical protein
MASPVPLFFRKPNWSSAWFSSVIFFIRPKMIFVKKSTSKIVTKIILGLIKKKMDEKLAEDQFGFRKNRGTGEAIFVFENYCREKFYSKQIIYIAFVDLLKAFNVVNWNVMMKILKKIKIDYRDRRIIRELCKHQTTSINIKEGKREAAIRKGVM